MKKFVLLAMAFSFAFSLSAKEWKKIRIGTEGAYPPFNFVDKDGKLVGLEIDFAKALCAELKVTCTFHAQDWDGIIPALLAKKYDVIIASLSITDDRKKTIEFSMPYYTTPNRFVVHKTSPCGLGTEPNGLTTKTIGVQKATVSENFIVENYKKSGIKSYVTIEEAFLDLKAKRVDLVFNDALSSSNGFLNTPAGKDFNFIGKEYTDPKWFGIGIGAGVRKSDKDLKKLLDKGIKALYSNGKFKKIADSYFPNTDIMISKK
ncbi:MAG: transporter substrate-binding domain-containing protein [SAR324 cluster bacterium]|nr:transporter substrate-binding domain-containing protein [SAR324 cluster bacterium]